MMIRLVPGDPIEVRRGERGISPERLAELRHEMGLDQPVWKQFARLCLAAAARRFRHLHHQPREPVLTEFFTLFPATVELSVCAMLFAVAARHPGRRHRRRQARQRLRPGADGLRAHRLFHADLLVGPSPHHARLRLLGPDARVGPDRSHQVLLRAGHRLHADRHPADPARRAPSRTRSATSSCRPSCSAPFRSPSSPA